MTQNQTPHKVQQNLIKVATFNLFNYVEPPSAYYDFENIYDSEQWQKKQRWIRDYLSECQPDVIGFQEVFSPDSLQQLLNEQGYPYFAVVDQPTLVTDYIYKSPVVAIASRYPIQSVEAVVADKEKATMMGLDEGFSFSRKPLRASIELPDLGLCDCYVVHFKSKRPTTDDADIDAKNNADKNSEADIAQILTQAVTGSWASSIQRGSEAALLLTHIIERRIQTKNPAMLMGDFNDDLKDGVLRHLLTYTTAGASETKEGFVPTQLQDSWELFKKVLLLNEQDASSLPNLATKADNNSSGNRTDIIARPFSHYYANKGSVIDYILLSCEFDTEYQENMAEVIAYHTYDRHLINPIFDRDSHSTDHAVVMISIKTRS